MARFVSSRPWRTTTATICVTPATELASESAKWSSCASTVSAGTFFWLLLLMVVVVVVVVVFCFFCAVVGFFVFYFYVTISFYPVFFFLSHLLKGSTTIHSARSIATFCFFRSKRDYFWSTDRPQSVLSGFTLLFFSLCFFSFSFFLLFFLNLISSVCWVKMNPFLTASSCLFFFSFLHP